MSKYKDRFPAAYQQRVGQFPQHKFLHDNSKELTSFLSKHKVISDNMNIFEIGSGGCRNLFYIWETNNNINLFANDLHEKASRKNMHEKIRNKVKFIEMDTLSMFRDPKEDVMKEHVDLLLSSDHLMHVDHESVNEILGLINSKWKPTYICLRELVDPAGEIIKRKWPRMYHDYDKYLSEKYDLVAKEDCKHFAKDMNWYKLLLYKRK